MSCTFHLRTLTVVVYTHNDREKLLEEDTDNAFERVSTFEVWAGLVEEGFKGKRRVGGKRLEAGKRGDEEPAAERTTLTLTDRWWVWSVSHDEGEESPDMFLAEGRRRRATWTETQGGGACVSGSFLSW